MSKNTNKDEGNKGRLWMAADGRAGQHFKCKFVVMASFIVGPKPDKKADDGHRSIAVYLLDGNRPRFMGTVGVPDRYPLPRVEQVVEVRTFTAIPDPKENSFKRNTLAKCAMTFSSLNAR